MIDKIDIFQRALHHRKVALLEHVSPNTDSFFVMKELFNDLNEKLGEIIDHVHALEGVKPAVKVPISSDSTPNVYKRTEAEREVLDRFVNPGETCLTISAKNVLSDSMQVYGFDVVMVKQLDSEMDDFNVVADRAIQLAAKRVIIGIHASLKEPWNMYMARVPFHWESYEYAARGNEMEYYIIDKEEGQDEPAETLAP